MQRMMALDKVSILVLAVHFLAYVNGQNEGSKCRGISRGKEFVVGFTNNVAGRSELHILVVAFSDNPTTVTISSRHQVNGARYEETFQLRPRGYRRTTIPIEFRLDEESGRSDKVLVVTASSEVTVYGTNYREHSTDAFLSLPSNQLGNRYVVVSVMTTRPGIRDVPIFAVIGLVDNTNVDITLTAPVSFEGRDYESGDVLSFTVDRHEIVQILSDTTSDFSGTIINSDSAVAAYGGHRCAATERAYCDILIEQLIPVDSWGKSHFFTATGSQRGTSIYKIAVFFENTMVTVPGIGVRSLNPGETWEVSISGSGVITSTLPSSVTQILRFIGDSLVDPSIIQVPSQEQFAFKFGFATPPKSGGDSSGFFNYVNIVVKADECSTVTLTGKILNCTETAVAINGTDYVVLTESLPKGEGAYFIEQRAVGSTSPMSVIVYGYEDDETYGYAAGLSLPNEGRLLSVTPFIVNENGGDELTTTLPCLEKASTVQSAVCRFRSGNTSYTPNTGELIDFYQVNCTTPIFSHVGLTSVDVSIDGGETFPYSDIIYVASQYDLPSGVTIDGLTPEFSFANLRAKNSSLTILWEPSDFPNTAYVSLGLFMEEGNRWSDEVVLETRVTNNGKYDLKSAVTKHADTLFGKTGNSIVGTIFFVMPHERDRSRRGIKDYIVKRSFRSELEDLRENNRADCDSWLDDLREGYQRLVNLPGCPPTLECARGDDRYSESNAGIGIYHRGAVACFRRDAANGAGTQCCYGQGGGFLSGPPGGGTADAFAPGFFGSSDHLRFDVRPWIACCYINPADCKTYYKFRPAVGNGASEINERYEKPEPAGGTGDPHFITLDQHEYTFNAVGEFAILQSDYHNVSFQGRMQRIPGRNASVFSAFVLRGESHPKLQIQRSSLNKTVVLLDNEQLQLVHKGFAIPKFTLGGGAEIEINADQTNIIVRLPFGLSIKFTISDTMMSYTIDLDNKFQNKIRGLLGNFNNNPEDDFTLPNGEVLPLNSTIREIHYGFGLKWMLNKSESMFTYDLSDDYEFYNRPNFVPNFNSPDPNDVSQEVAEICGSNVQCLYDALNTGSLEFANETLSGIRDYNAKKEILHSVVNCQITTGFVNVKYENTVYYVNSSYEFKCQEGFRMVGNAVAFCGKDGNWTTELPSCARIEECKIPDEFTNGNIKDAIYYANSSYTFSCKEWYFLYGDDTVFCDANGNWGSGFPSCVSVWLIVALSIAVFVIFVALLVAIVCVKMHRCTSKNII